MQKIRTIEGLRGVLALWVVLGHVLAAAGLGEYWRGPFKVVAAGGNAVDCFIIVSGFVIFYLLDTAREGYGQFIWRRFLRLYPVYLICLLASMAVLPMAVAAFAHAPWPHSLNSNRVVLARASLEFLPQHLVAHLLMLHSLLPDLLLPSANYAILGQAWSLSLEWQFYVLAPFLFLAIARGGRPAMAVITGACALHFLVGGNEGFLPRHIPMFAIGIASYYAWCHPWRPRSRLFAPAGVALAYLSTHSPGVVVWATVFLSAYATDAFAFGALKRLLESPLAIALGRMSYSIYLSHAMVLTLAMFLCERVGAARLGQWPFFVLLMGLTTLGTLIASRGLYRYVEAPCIAFGKRSAARITAPDPALG